VTRRQILLAVTVIFAVGAIYLGILMVTVGASPEPSPQPSPSPTRIWQEVVPTTAAPAAPATSSPVPVVKAPTTPPAAEPEPDVYYRSCAEVRAAGKAPIRRGQPGYRTGLDRDNDGIACDT
jgi:hypothetical protein